MTQHSTDPDPRWWHSLADGAAATALRHMEIDGTSHGWLRTVITAPVHAHPEQATVFDGAPALAFVLAASQRQANRVLETLDEHVDTVVRTRLRCATSRLDRGIPPVKREYDLIAGLTGLGTYLLYRHGEGPLLRDVLQYLVWLTHPLRSPAVPGWWAADSLTGSVRQPPGAGHGNLGLAHGISGPLALLALTSRRGVIVRGQREAMERIVDWLDHWRCGTGERVWWPGWISRAEYDTGIVRQSGPQRPSWCYGTPGLARAQQLAGLALHDVGRQRSAERALHGCLADPAQLAQLSEATLCHGWAGVLHTAWRMGLHNEHISDHVPYLREQLAVYRRQHPPPGHGLLTGDDGVRLAEHAATRTVPPNTDWDACLLLSE